MLADVITNLFCDRCWVTLLNNDRWTAIYVISGRYYVWCRLMLCLLDIGLMLCPLADVVANLCITIGVIRLRANVIALIGCGRCYCQVADGIATGWTILFLVGRCYSHVADVITTGWIFISPLVLSCSTEPHPIYEAGGICLYSCLGMDCSP